MLNEFFIPFPHVTARKISHKPGTYSNTLSQLIIPSPNLKVLFSKTVLMISSTNSVGIKGAVLVFNASQHTVMPSSFWTDGYSLQTSNKKGRHPQVYFHLSPLIYL